MLRNVFLIVLSFCVFVACELSRDEEVQYEKVATLQGFIQPKKIVLIDKSKAIVLDEFNGIGLLDVSQYETEIIKKSSFLFDADYYLPNVTIKPDDFLTIPGIIPYNSKSEKLIVLKPVDIAYVKKDSKDILWVLTYVDSSTASSSLEGAYFVYAINVSDFTSINEVKAEDVYSLDAFSIDSSDIKYDLGNVARYFTATKNALFITGNTKTPLRVITLADDAQSVHENMKHDQSGDRTTLKIVSTKKTLDPGVIAVSEDDTKIFVSSRNTGELGFHTYTVDAEYKPSLNGNLSVSLKYFPKSLQIAEDLTGPILVACSYHQINLFDLDAIKPIKKITTNSDYSISDAVLMKTGSKEYLIASYNYKIIENKYSDYGYDHRFLYSGLVMYENYRDKPKKKKDIKLRGVVRSIVAMEVAGHDVLVAASSSTSSLAFYIMD